MSDDEVRAYLATSGFFQLGRNAGSCWKYVSFRDRWPAKLRDFETSLAPFAAKHEEIALGAFHRSFPGAGQKMMDAFMLDQAKENEWQYKESDCATLVEAVEGMSKVGPGSINVLLVSPYYETARKRIPICSR